MFWATIISSGGSLAKVPWKDISIDLFPHLSLLSDSPLHQGFKKSSALLTINGAQLQQSPITFPRKHCLAQIP